MKIKAAMIKTSKPVVKDGLGILARLVVIALLLSILSALLQGCAGNAPAGSHHEAEPLSITVQEVDGIVVSGVKLFKKVS